jgi:superfamily II DNA or RNA helicase
MQVLPREELRLLFDPDGKPQDLDNPTALRLKNRLAEEFRDQITLGVPTNEDEAGLRRLAKQIQDKKVRVKLFLRHPLHAKLYLLFRDDYNNPVTGFLGSSNLTLPGLSSQGELNVDITEHDACNKLVQWFEDRWNDRWCLDISDDLVKIINESWAGERQIPPYHIYIKMAYHLCREAREGLDEYRLPREFEEKLFEFQRAAVKIAAHHLNKRGGVLVADVVGLGKTLTACALARIFQDDHSLETLIICPKNLVSMWEDHVERYRMIAKVLPISMATRELPNLRRYRLLVIDESHNLRNRETETYKAIFNYVQKNDSKCILLTATPYNKTYLDLSNQLRLFVPDEADLGIRPERLLKEIGEVEFVRKHQCPMRSLAAFEKSEYPQDWQELMRLFMVRRTRSFIRKNYAKVDPSNGRPYLTFDNGTGSYFPIRVPKTVKFPVNEKDRNDQYARLYSQFVVEKIALLELARYGLGNFIAQSKKNTPTKAEEKIINDLSRAGKRLMGFCRTNLFKRLESSGITFLQSVSHHILRNYIFIHALENNLPIPIGTQDIEIFDTRTQDEDAEACTYSLANGYEELVCDTSELNGAVNSEDWFRRRAAEIYDQYARSYKSRFGWLRASLFAPDLKDSLLRDAQSLLQILDKCGKWDPNKDAKLKALEDLLTRTHPNQKVLVFTQFADTVRYLVRELKNRGVDKLEGVTGEDSNPTSLAWRFSPESNDKRRQISPRDDELRVLIATDVLSEGQNLQDCSIIVNYDLPWAIIRLIQRAGRVDRIGQKSEEILCYSFVPADGVERLIRLRERVRQRLQENAEVVGTDEAFFEDEMTAAQLQDIFTEKAGLLDDEEDDEVDIASYAYQIWKDATERDPELKKIIPQMPNVVYSTKSHNATKEAPNGVLVYVRTAEGNDALAWMDNEGNSVTLSPLAILKAAECKPDTPAMPRHEMHHELVKAGVEHLVREEKSIGGQLGRPTGARFKTYERLKHYAQQVKGTLMDTPELAKAIDDIYKYPLRQSAVDTLNRLIKSGATDQVLADVVINLRREDKLCIVQEELEHQQPKLICSMGLFSQERD